MRRTGTLLVVALLLGLPVFAGQSAAPRSPEEELARWDRMFATQPAHIRWEPTRFLTEVAATLKPGDAIDVGMGSGRNALYLARSGWRVTGVDTSAVGVQRARALASEQQLPFTAVQSDMFRKSYGQVFEGDVNWNGLEVPSGDRYAWDDASTYVRKAPYFDGLAMEPAPVEDILGARVLAKLGDSVTTDHISPAGSIRATSPAGVYLLENDVSRVDFNSYGARRGNHEVMMRGTFANVRIKNLMVPAKSDGTRVEGGVTILQPDREQMPIYDAAMEYIKRGTPTVVFGGEEYGTGSSRDWAAKGTQLLGIKAVVARSFERIHRSNLVGMGVLPLQFKPGESWESLGLVGDETVDVLLGDELRPQSDARLAVTRADGIRREVAVTLRIDTAIEVDYYRHGGILPFVLRQLLAA